MTKPYRILNGNCLDQLKTLEDNSVDSVVTDPPYGLSAQPDMMKVLETWMRGEEYRQGKGFMGKEWDSFVPGPAIWKEVYRVLKPGGHILAFSGTRTYDLTVLAIRLAGFEIRDMISWVYGSGMPKSHNIGKAIDKRGGKSVSWFGSWFRRWREDNGITQREVSALFPSVTGKMTGCVANWELGYNMPTPDQYNLICKRYKLPFQSIEEAHREVVGQQEKDRLAVTPGQGYERPQVTINITAPATPEAAQWEGWGTALKPSVEPVVLARKPLEGTVAENVLKHGTGGLNIDGCRVGVEERTYKGSGAQPNKLNNHGTGDTGIGFTDGRGKDLIFHATGRWPANFIHDGSAEVLEGFPHTKGATGNGNAPIGESTETGLPFRRGMVSPYADEGSAARFFYCAKASPTDRDEGLDIWEDTITDVQALHRSRRMSEISRIDGNPPKVGKNTHPTVKPTSLCRYLCKLITPPDGVVLDPFMGSGSTGKAAMLEGFQFIGIDMEQEYCEIAEARIEFVLKEMHKPLTTKKPKASKKREDESSAEDTPSLFDL